VGLPDLLLAPWVLEREGALEIYGPKGISEMTENILDAYKLDIQERLEGLEPANTSGYKAKCQEIAPGFVYQDKLVKVKAFSVNHGSWDAFGYRIHTPDRIIVISGDTAPFDGNLGAYRDCDVLIHEVYSAEGFKRRSRQWQKYHASVHTSSYELAEIASEVKPGLLILYHQLFFGVSEDDLVWEVRQGYDGHVVSGKDLEVY
jgi:ribonuclease BN (tRNA processing enzyme)